jgi:hypothetical protein
MNLLWIVVGLATSGIVAAVLRRHRRGRQTDLGFVSQHWVSENRLSQLHDTRR